MNDMLFELIHDYGIDPDVVYNTDREDPASDWGNLWDAYYSDLDDVA